MTDLGPEICARLDALAACSAEPGRLTRVYLSPEQKQANELIGRWMQEAGMAVRLDAIGNIIGRYEGNRPGLPVLMLGSHLDTVRDAGRYDGMLGVVAAISCIGQMHRDTIRMPFAVEVVGFCDEEGVRFGAPLIGSRAMAGTFDPAWLDRRDADGITLRGALETFGLDPARIATAKRGKSDLLAYVELHIEQGPVLERHGLPVGCVTGISGATRLRVTLSGEAGHAGTVPMDGRRDAIAGAAESILAIEAACSGIPGLVGTVGMIEAQPGAINVIPGQAILSLDVRSPDDSVRQDALARINARVHAIAARRRLDVAFDTLSESAAAPCAPWLVEQIHAAIAAEGIDRLDLPSGAGHDGMAMIHRTDIGMIFVRCTGGISHNPAEAITIEDAETGAQVLLRFIRDFKTKQ